MSNSGTVPRTTTFDVAVRSLSLSRSAVALHGVPPAELQWPALTPEAIHALAPLLESYGFDVSRPIAVVELPEWQGFHLSQ